MKKVLSILALLLAAVATGAWAQDPTYIVAGNYSEIFEIPWYGTYEANKMTKGGDGKYTKTYNVEDAFSDIQLKVVKDGEDWIGDETGNNVTFSMKQAGSFTVTLDPNANPVCVTVTGDNVVFANTEYAINYATGMQNGTVTGPDTAKEDDEVTLTITPAAGYVLESISVTGVTTENAVEVTDGKFTMPAEDVNVIATFKLVTYAVTLAEGTEDAANWTISPASAAENETVTITYAGTKSVKSVTAKRKTATGNITVYFTDALDYGDVHIYYWSDGPEWPGTAMTEVGTNEYSQKIYKAVIPATAVGIIFNGNGSDTGDITENIADGSWWYTTNNNEVVYNDKYTENIEVTNVDDNKWTFTMPDCNVELDIEYYPAHPVTISDGDVDATNWSATPTEQSVGQNVTLKYTGRKKIKRITIVAAPISVDLSTISEAYTASDGETLTGTLGANVQISIAAGATVTLDGVTIEREDAYEYHFAGLTCLGNATIILNGTNTVKGFDGYNPGIHVPAGYTVTIKGSGSLTASSSGSGAGIGGGDHIACGNIEIQGGTITATGDSGAAGIGGGPSASCGNITISGGTVTAQGGGSAAGIGSGDGGSCGTVAISGGTVTATGGLFAAGIGSGSNGSSCGDITITSGVTHVTATMGVLSPNSIGAGDGGSCGTVSIEDPSKVTEN